MSMGFRIRQARNNKGFTQEYVAGALGVSRQAVFKWEKNLIALSELLDVSVDYLTKGVAEKGESRRYSGEAFFRASILPLLLLPICWIIGVFSGEYTDMVQIPMSNGASLGLPFLMFGHSPAAIALVVVSVVSLILFVLLLFLGHFANKQAE